MEVSLAEIPRNRNWSLLSIEPKRSNPSAPIPCVSSREVWESPLTGYPHDSGGIGVIGPRRGGIRYTASHASTTFIHEPCPQVKILKSKIAVPEPLSHEIARPALISDLSSTQSLAFVAPAGFGKTTYVAQQLRSTGQPIAWLSLQPEDRHPSRFCALLWESVLSAIPDFAGSGIEAERGTLDSAETLAESLCYFSQEAETKPGWICLDNFEVVQRTKTIAQAMNHLVTHGGKRLRIAITSRDFKGLGLSLLEGRELVRVVRQDELVFTRRDIAALMNAQETEDSQRDVERAFRKTRGWPVAVGMWARKPKREGHADTEPDASAESFQSFVDEVLLQELEVDFRNFLFRTSFFDVVDSGNGEAAGFHEDEVRRHLASMKSSSLPILKLGKDQFRVHSALRDALSREFRDSVSSEVFYEAVVTAARSLEEGPQVEFAVDLLIEHGLFPQVFETWIRQNERLLPSWHRFDEWLDSIPPKHHSAPIYVRVKGNRLARTHSQEEAIAFLGSQIDALEDPVDRLAVWAMLSSSRINAGRVRGPDDLLSEAEAWKKAVPGQASQVDWVLAWASVSELQLKRAIDLTEPHLEALPRQDRLVLDAYILSWRGQLGQDVVEDSLRLSRDVPNETANEIVLQLRVVAADLLLSAGRLREAREIVGGSKSRRETAKYQLESSVTDELFVEGMCLWRLGNEADGLAALGEAVSRYKSFGPIDQLRARVVQEYLWRQTQGAQSSIDAGDEIDFDELASSPLHYPGDVRLPLLCLRALRNRDDGATVVECGTEVLRTAEKEGLNPWMVTGSFLVSWGFFQEQRFDEADVALVRGLDALDSVGWETYPMAWKDLTAYAVVRAFDSERRVDVARRLVVSEEFIPLEVAFASALRDADLDHDRVERLLVAATTLRVRGLNTFVSSSEQTREARANYTEWNRTAPLPSLWIQLFGRFTVSGRDGARKFRRSASKTILQALVLAGDSAIHEEQLIEQCWPETELDKGRANLQTAVNDLRRDLDPQYTARGNSYVVYEDGSYYLSLPEGSRVDLTEFTRTTARFFATADPGEAEVAEVLRHLETARSELLPEARYESFTELARLRSRSAAEKATLAAAAALESKARRSEAIDLLQAALDHDPLWQDGVEAILKSLRAEGRNIAAIRTLRGYEARLLRETGLTPDDRLLALLALPGRTG